MGQSITFMAKPNDREGSSCHIHLSVRGLDDSVVFRDEGTGQHTALYGHFIAGVLTTMREFPLELQPITQVNAYTSDAVHVPPTLREAREPFTDSELRRGFERL